MGDTATVGNATHQVRDPWRVSVQGKSVLHKLPKVKTQCEKKVNTNPKVSDSMP